MDFDFSCGLVIGCVVGFVYACLLQRRKNSMSQYIEVDPPESKD